MRVALLTDADVFAGTERHILTLAMGLHRVGLDIHIACPTPSPLAAMAIERGLHVHMVQKGRSPDFQAVTAIQRMVSRCTIDIVHAHNGRSALLAAMAVPRQSDTSVLMTQHFISPARFGRQGLKGWASRRMHGWLEKRLDHVIAISSAVADATVTDHLITHDKMTVVHNGIADPDRERLRDPREVRRELGIPQEAPLIVCVARLEPEKSIDTLIAAMAEVRDTRPDARCLIVGQGRQRQQLERAMIESQVGDCVRLLGFRQDVLDIVNACDVAALPSPAEPFGLCILEAMALGKPVVATDAGGPAEILTDGETGYLVHPNAPKHLAKAIGKVLADPGHATWMGINGRERYLSQFTERHMAKRVAKVYTRVQKHELLPVNTFRNNDRMADHELMNIG